MKEFNLLYSYPKSKRNVEKRSFAKTDEHIQISRKYEFDYFDGDRAYGYGGYNYDGRWQKIATDIIDHWGLKKGMKLLDIGCAKGFLVKDLLLSDNNIDSYGIDISDYALKNCEKEVVGRLHLGNMIRLPFPDNSFEAVTCINTLHNLKRNDCITAIKEMSRICSTDKIYIQVDSYRKEEEKELFEDWVLTAYTHYYPDKWQELFREAGFKGEYYWTFISN